MVELSIDLIEDAIRLLRSRIRHTPLEYSEKLSRIVEAPVWLKLEAVQVTGSFKVRGAIFAMSQLSEKSRGKGIATVSAGNHGKAVAYAAKQMRVPVTIYVPRTVDRAKYRDMVSLGAEVVISEYDGYDDTADWAMDKIRASGNTFIHPYEDPVVMAGNGGSLAAEVLRDLPQAKNFVLPVGGGGLAAGFSFYTKHRARSARNIGCELEACPSLRKSLEIGRAVTHLRSAETVGLALDGGVGLRAFRVLRECLDDCVSIREKELIMAWRWLLSEHQFLIEPSSAVTVAACLGGHVRSISESTVLVLSGRNVDIAQVERLLFVQPG